jgi:hypothetical protein
MSPRRDRIVAEKNIGTKPCDVVPGTARLIQNLDARDRRRVAARGFPAAATKFADGCRTERKKGG